MSLINQMLRDLDRRRGPATCAQVTALHGLGLVSHTAPHGSRHLLRFGGGLVVAAIMALGYWGAGRVPVEVQFNRTSIADGHALSRHEPQRRTVAAGAVTPSPVMAALPPVESADGHAHALQKKAPRSQAVHTRVDAGPAGSVNAAPKAPVPTRVAFEPSAQTTATGLYNRAQQALAGLRTDVATSLLERVLKMYPQHSDARQQLAMLLLQAHRPARAETLLADGLALTPRQPQLTQAYAQLLVERGALHEALAVLRDSTDDPRADTQTLALQAAIQTRLQQFDNAAASYRRALQRSPRQGIWWSGLGVVLEHAGRPAQALEAYRQAGQLPLPAEVGRFVQQRFQTLRVPKAHPQG